jgi:hypothetical protein
MKVKFTAVPLISLSMPLAHIAPALAGDGTDDIVWQLRDGQVHYWVMANGAQTGGFNISSPVGAEWSLKGVGDVR